MLGASKSKLPIAEVQMTSLGYRELTLGFCIVLFSTGFIFMLLHVHLAL